MATRTFSCPTARGTPGTGCYARLMAGFARDAGCDAVVGHSLGANVAEVILAAVGAA